MGRRRPLKDRYELTRVVGRGGMAEVWEARDLKAHDDVAVKTVEVASEPRRAEWLSREAKLTAVIDHPGVVDVRDVGVDLGTAFLVMDLLPGRDLAEELRDGPPPLREALRVAVEVAGALEATHRAGVIHRDIKPANIVVGGDDVTLIDFGIAANGHPRGAGRATFGTAHYMAPEQVSSAEVGPAADMYAFGCLLTSLVAGRPPFVGDQPIEVLRHHVRAVPPRLTQLAPGVPAELATLVERLLAKTPEVRPTATEAKAHLERMLQLPRLRRAAIAPVPRATLSQETGSLDAEATTPMLVATAVGAMAGQRAA